MDQTVIIPQVDQYERGDGFFDLREGWIIRGDQLSQVQERLLEQYLRDADVSPEQQGKGSIELQVEGEARYDEAGFCEERYTILIEQSRVRIAGATPEGLARGIQTFRQLIYTAENGKIPAARLSDAPRFRWRGVHLDVSRHFFPPEDVRRLIDHLALYRYNRLHLHLTDDQGWRIEIKGYPALTAAGSVRQKTLVGHHNRTPRRYDGKAYGGFYTQEQIRELVRYAADREIVIVPEIDMPGHMQAAVAAYPALGCGYHTAEVRPLWGISQDILNVEESTVTVMENILEEVMALFPGRFLHIGGDEVPKYQWENSERIHQRMAELGVKDEEELQSWFIRRMDDFITSRGRRTIGWDEILEGGLADNAAVMSWRGEEGGIRAAGMGHDVVMTPYSHTYFDYYQDLPEQEEPLAIGGFTPLSKVYAYEPVPEELSRDQAGRVLGSQGQLWTEYIPDRRHLEYMAFPRVCALAEVLWLRKEEKNYSRFLMRLRKHREIFRRLGINAHPRPE